MQQKIGTLRLALTFAGCFLGAGYVSGQELWQYFGAFGARGLLGLALAVVLLGGTGVLLLRLSARTGIETMDALIVRADIPWLRTAVGVLTAALLFGVVCIMAAGIGRSAIRCSACRCGWARPLRACSSRQRRISASAAWCRCSRSPCRA